MECIVYATNTKMFKSLSSFCSIFLYRQKQTKIKLNLNAYGYNMYDIKLL